MNFSKLRCNDAIRPRIRNFALRVCDLRQRWNDYRRSSPATRHRRLNAHLLRRSQHQRASGRRLSLQTPAHHSGLPSPPAPMVRSSGLSCFDAFV